jgi:hypothetical protein
MLPGGSTSTVGQGPGQAPHTPYTVNITCAQTGLHAVLRSKKNAEAPSVSNIGSANRQVPTVLEIHQIYYHIQKRFISDINISNKSRDISVGIATRLRAGRFGVLGFDSRRNMGIFLFTTASRTVLGPTQPPIQWVPVALFLGVKRLERETE